MSIYKHDDIFSLSLHFFSVVYYELYFLDMCSIANSSNHVYDGLSHVYENIFSCPFESVPGVGLSHVA